MPSNADLDQQLSGLLARAQDGDGQAYEQFLSAAAGIVRSFVRRRLPHDMDAEDMVQDVLLAVHRHRHTYDPNRAVAPWLYAITRHRLLDALKKHRRLLLREVLDQAGSHDSPRLEDLSAESSGADQPCLGHLHRALAELSSAQREIIRLLKFEGYSVLEIAARTGRTPSSVKVTAHRGYKLLRKLLEGPLRDH